MKTKCQNCDDYFEWNYHPSCFAPLYCESCETYSEYLTTEEYVEWKSKQGDYNHAD